ncbi:MAG: Na+/H+ antiporter subunit E [Armatimonadota bacterium]|nr:Na+/H+ antiporter subunit E [Armatimonadota bacterium]MDR7421906.1 Na+/H+ antiporter subunit E [Armatimonadota bacterium]MDR7454463.1 Na+/H+ antiporter subunit E [Armatimonadota bacterium]MDR7457796.1 Na+/H+ antiporter subunit E [Armatimonadota bacterium]MDR7497296.1 Na+/H+ antiporter subunit E [Armatimonadota bacterium]
MLLANVLLALAWVALTGHFSAANLAAGFALGFAVLWLATRVGGSTGYFRQVREVAGFVVFVAWELVLANLRVAYHILAPLDRMRPGIVAVPLDVRTDAEITMLANLITLTPGTLSLDVSESRRVLYVHTLALEDPASFRAGVKAGYERRVQEVFD